jgi:hypothetical protein
VKPPAVPLPCRIPLIWLTEIIQQGKYIHMHLIVIHTIHSIQAISGVIHFLHSDHHTPLGSFTTVSKMSHTGCDLPGLYLILRQFAIEYSRTFLMTQTEQSDTLSLRFSTYWNCICLARNMTEYPIVDLSDIRCSMASRVRFKSRCPPTNGTEQN